MKRHDHQNRPFLTNSDCWRGDSGGFKTSGTVYCSDYVDVLRAESAYAKRRRKKAVTLPHFSFMDKEDPMPESQYINAACPSKSFDVASAWDSELGRNVRRQHIRCSRPGCEASESVVVTGGPLPPNELTKRFSARGWSVGSTRAKDLCPDHSSTRRPAVPPVVSLSDPPPPALALPPSATPPPSPPTPAIEETTAVTEPKPDLKIVPAEPRVATREEKRRIMLSLEEFYDTDRRHYTGSHSDKSVAAHLRMPWKWGADVREEFFGPEGSEQLYQALQVMESLRADVPRAVDDLHRRHEAGLQSLRAETQRRLDEGVARLEQELGAERDKLRRRLEEAAALFERLMASS